MSSRAITECGCCGSRDLELVLDLGFAPPPCVVRPVTEPVAQETVYPVQLLRCSDCTLVQMGCVVDPEIVFPADYGYSSGNSGQLHRSFEALAASVTVGYHDLVVDIGANDGTLLSKFPGCRKLAVEPTNQILKVKGAGTVQAPFSRALAETAVSHYGRARVVTACNVLAHVENIHDVMEGISLLLADDGVLVAENHDLASIVDGGQWDTCYHEHLRFYSPHSFARLLERHGLYVHRLESIPTHGGSFRVHASREKPANPPVVPDGGFDWRLCRERALRARYLLRAGLAAHRAGGRRIAGVGATARATAIIHYCGLDVEDVAYVCEVAGSDKIGTFMPGTRIPVVDEKCVKGARGLDGERPEALLLFSWHLADAIVPAFWAGNYGGEFVVPLPELRYVRKHKADPNRGWK